MADYKSYNARRGGRYGRGRFGAGRRGFRGPRNNYRFRSSNKKNGEHFLGPFSEDYVKEFLKIRNNDKLTKAELKKAEEEFIAKQPTEIQEKYKKFIEDLNQKRNEFEETRSKKYEELSPEAKKLFDEVENIKKEENISFKEERNKIRSLLAKADNNVRNELRKINVTEKQTRPVRISEPKAGKGNKRSQEKREKTFSFLEGLDQEKIDEYLAIRKENKSLPKKEVNALEAAWASKQDEAVKKNFEEYVENVEKKKKQRLESNRATIDKLVTQLNTYINKLEALKLDPDTTYENELKEIKEVEYQTIRTLRYSTRSLFPRLNNF
uniref:DUF148 domain-containing protein n=1 Tax=Strongyloides papillosus TaxID=174720 RepID=A0A0N5BPH4_STREA